MITASLPTQEDVAASKLSRECPRLPIRAQRINAARIRLHLKGLLSASASQKSLPSTFADKPGEIKPAMEQEQQPGGGDYLEHLRRLQSFRKRNAYALIALPSASRCSSGTLGEDIATSAAQPSYISLCKKDSTGRPAVAYRLNHLSCSLTPTVSCFKLDYTRYPSDAPPRVNLTLPREGVATKDEKLDNNDDDISIQEDILFTRLIIPNTAPTSIQNTDHNYYCYPVLVGDHNVADSLSIAHQKMG